MNDDKLTDDVLHARVEQALNMLRAAGVQDLALHVDRLLELARKLGQDTIRTPWGLEEKRRLVQTHHEGALIDLEPIEPWIPCTLEHVVLPQAVAEAYELVDMRVGAMQQLIGPTSVPLDTFSIEFVREHELLYRSNEWKTDVCRTGTRIEIRVRVRESSAPPFRGVAWLRGVSPEKMR